MAKYNPFAEKAGMRKIAEQPPSKKGLKIATVQEELGFNIQLLGSEKYVLSKLQPLKAEDITKIKEAFIRNKAPRFMKYFFPHEPYGRQKLYRKKVMKSQIKRSRRKYLRSFQRACLRFLGVKRLRRSLLLKSRVLYFACKSFAMKF